VVKYGVVTSYPTSLKVVGADIVSVIRKMGHEADLHVGRISPVDAIKKFEKSIIFMPFIPLSVATWIVLYSDYKKFGIPTAMYTTIEGVPKKQFVPRVAYERGEFVANSKYTKEMLEKVDLNVVDIVYHGINLDDVAKSVDRKKSIKRQLGAKVLFGTVATTQPRKGLDKLAMIAKALQDKLPDAKFYVLTQPEGAVHFSGLKNVFLDTRYGELKREEVLRLFSNFDFYLCTSHAEGFCLPVLEAQAFGTPVICARYPPLDEVTHPTANLFVNPTNMKYEDFLHGILYTMYYYDVDEMAKAVEEAYLIYENDRKKYNNMKRTVRNFARKFDIMRVYPKLVKMVG